MVNAELASLFPVVMPHIQRWFVCEEATIQRNGIPLTAAQARDAGLAGVQKPGRVRVMAVEEIKVHGIGLMQKLAPGLQLIRPDSSAMTFGYGIIIRRLYAKDRSVLLHHLVHVAQMEELGGSENYIKRYINDCLQFGYGNAPLEIQARFITEQAMQVVSPRDPCSRYRTYAAVDFSGDETAGTGSWSWRPGRQPVG
jgi:hypothetical protein